MALIHRHSILIMLAALTAREAAAQTVTIPTAPTVSAVTTVQTTYTATAAAAPQLTPDQLDQLTSTIALYPDPLLASTLAAAVYPAEVTAAAQWLAVNPAPTDELLNLQPWQISVKALVRYPTVLNLLAQYPAWTTSLGTAFASQPADVMASVQRLRSQAYSVGNLVTTTQQSVIVSNTYIQIVPAEPTVLYVPVYDPRVVYVQRPVAYRPYVTFSLGVQIGDWMDIDFDWHERRVVTGVAVDRRWYLHRDTPRAPVHVWTPAPRPVVVAPQPRIVVPVRPQGPTRVEYRGWGPQPQRASAFEDHSDNRNFHDHDDRHDDRDHRGGDDNRRNGPDRDHSHDRPGH